jgi:hypothetical protein
MNDARREEIRRVLTLIKEAKGILEVVLDQQQDDFDKMPKDATCCEDAISACEEVLRD